MKPIIFLPEAEQEMLEAARYYQEQASGLGLDFLLEIERAVHSIAQSPHTWRSLRASYEGGLSEGFPWEFYTG